MPDLYATPHLQADIRAGQAPLWSDYLKTAGIGTTDLLAAVPAGTRYAAELTDTDLGESIASGSQYLQDVVHGWGEDLEAGLSEPAKENLLAEFGSEAFWKHPFSSIALKATRTTPSMAATVAGTMLTGGGAPALAALAGIQGGLSATQTVDEMYRAIDSQSDADLRVNSKLYNQFRQDGLSEREARRQLNQVNIGAKPAVLFAVGAATSLFGPEAQVLRGLGAKGLGAAYSGGIARRTGKAMGAGAVSEAIETGAESLATEQGAVDVGFQSAINPYRVAAATAEGATLGALFGTVGGLKGPTRPPVRPTTNANTRPEPDNPPAAAIKPIVAPAPGPVSMPGKGSNTQATPPIVAGREGHTAATSRVATVPGAKGDAFKKSKGAKSNVVPLVQPAPATGTAATATPVTPQVVAPAPQGDPGGLVADQTQVAALAAQTAPTRPPAPPTPTPVQAVPTAGTAGTAGPLTSVQNAPVETQPAAPTGPAPTPSQTAPPPSVQTPGAGFGAGTVAAPVTTQAVPTEEATPSAFGGVAQPVVAPTVQPAVQPTVPVITAPVVTPVAPVTPKTPKVTGDKNTQRTEARTRDAQVAQDFLNARPAEPVVPTTLPEVDAFVADLKNTLEQVRALGVKFRKRVSGEKMPASIVWLRELETAYNKLKSGKLGAKATNKVISEFITREIQIKAGDVKDVKATRKGEGTTAMAVPQGNVETLAAGPQQAATEEEAARRESEEVSLEETTPVETIAGEEAAPDVGVSEEVTETVSEEGEVSHEKAEVGEVTEKPKPGQVSKDDVVTKVKGGRVKGIGAPEEEVIVDKETGKRYTLEEAKAKGIEGEKETRAKAADKGKSRTDLFAQYNAAQRAAEAAAKADAKSAPEPEKLPPKVTPETIKAKAAEKKAAQEAKLPPKVKRKKLVSKPAPKPSGKAALAEELEKVDPNPSQAKIAADNAAKAHIRIGGLPIAVSTVKNTERQGVTPTGRRWSWLYKFHYGHILGTKAPDGKPIDVFLGPKALPNNPVLETVPVVVIDQVDPDTKVSDEPKVMLGFDRVVDAVEAYESSYPRGAERRGDVAVYSLDEFKAWLKTKSDAEPAGAPVSDVDVAVEEAVDTVVADEIAPDRAARISMKAWLAGKRDSPRTEMNRRVRAYQENAFEKEKIAAAFSTMTGKVSDFLDVNIEAIRGSFLDKISKAIFPRFAKRIRELAGDVQVYVVPDDVFTDQIGQPQTAGAVYSVGGDYILIRESEVVDDVSFANLVLHEATHAAFMKVIYSNPKLIAQLDKIFVEALAGDIQGIGPPHYGLTNIDELVAEAFSNQRFQEFLLGIKASDGLIKELGLDGKYKSLWDVLVRYISKALGFPKSHDSLFAAVMKVSARASLEVPNLPGPASSLAVRNYIQQLDLENAPKLTTDRAFQIPEVFNKRLPPQVRQAPQQQQQGSPWLLGGRTMDQLIQLAKGFGTNFYKHLRRAGDAIEKIRVTADRYLTEAMPIIHEQLALQRKYKGTGLWQEAVNLWMEETETGVDASKDLASQVKLLGKNTLRGAYPKARWAELNARWKAIDAVAPDLSAHRVRAMDFFRDQQNLERIGIIRNSLKVAGFTDTDLAQRLFDGDETDADIALLKSFYDHIKDASELAKIKGPYFPQMRRGDYVVRALYKIIAPTNAFREIPDEDGYVRTWEFAGKDARKQAINYARAQKDTGLHPTINSVWVDTNTGSRYLNEGQPDEVRVSPKDVDAEQRFRVTIQNRYVEFFESKREARQVAYELRNDAAVEPDSVQDVVEKQLNLGDRQTDLMSHQMQVLSSSLQRRPGYQSLSPNEQNQVVQALNIASLRLLSHTRIQTKRLPRTHVLGASRDFTRNTLEYAQSVSGYLARLDHQDELNTAMREARKEANSANDYGKGGGQSSIMNEMERRVAKSTAFEERGRVNDWINRMLAVSFADKLISPAYNLLNSLQPIMMSLPALSARHGPGRSASTLLKVYNDIGAAQILKSGLIASKRTLMQGPLAETPSIIDDVKARLKSKQEIAMLDYLIERGSIDPDAGIEIANMIETRTGIVGGLDQGINAVQTFGRQMPRSIEAINRTVTALAAYRLEMARSGDYDAAVRYAQETTNMTQGLYSHSNAAPIFNHPLGKISFQFKKYGQLVYGLIGHNVGKAIRNAEPGDRAEAIKTLTYMAATHVVLAGALGLPTEPLKWLIIGANQAGITEANWADVENQVREVLSSAFGAQLGEIAARGASRALPEGFAFDMSSRVGLQDLFTFGEPRGADDQSLKAYMWDLVAGAPGSLAKDWFAGSQALMNGKWGEASEKFTPIKVVADAIKSYRQTSEGKKTAAGYESLAPYGAGEATLRVLGFTPAREIETSEARNYFYSATKRAAAARNELMHQWVQASSSERGRLWGQVERFNRGKTRDERLTRKDLDQYVKRRRTEERGGLVQGGFRVTKRERNMYKKTMSIYGANP